MFFSPSCLHTSSAMFSAQHAICNLNVWRLLSSLFWFAHKPFHDELELLDELDEEELEPDPPELELLSSPELLAPLRCPLLELWRSRAGSGACCASPRACGLPLPLCALALPRARPAPLPRLPSFMPHTTVAIAISCGILFCIQVNVSLEICFGRWLCRDHCLLK